MSFQYSQSTGALLHDGKQIGVGYSGNGSALNNPANQDLLMHGPLPQGHYSIQPPSDHPKLGPVAMALLPDPGNEMFNRSAFFIHGDNTQMNHTASDGCIILSHNIRCAIGELVLAGDNQLEVTA